MIGTSHNIESNFMDQLPISLRPVAISLLKLYRLKQLVEMHKTQSIPKFTHSVNLSKHQFQEILKVVILTKISYFTITPEYPNSYIDKLIEITAYILNMKGAGFDEIHQEIKKEYVFFADWIKKAQHARMVKHKIPRY